MQLFCAQKQNKKETTACSRLKCEKKRNKRENVQRSFSNTAKSTMFGNNNALLLLLRMFFVAFNETLWWCGEQRLACSPPY